MSACGLAQVTNGGAVQPLPKPSPGIAAGLDFSGFAATVKLKGGRQETGWFLIVADTVQKLYWWRFQGGTPPPPVGTGATDYFGDCAAARGKGTLAIACATDRRVMIAVSKNAYTDANALADLVRSAFTAKAASLDTGFDYFNKTINLWTVLGPSFFAEPGHAQGIRRLAIQSLAASGDGWTVTIGGASGKAAVVSLSPALDITGQPAIR